MVYNELLLIAIIWIQCYFCDSLLDGQLTDS